MSMSTAKNTTMPKARGRIRHDSGSKLDYYYKMVANTILCNQVSRV